LPRPNRFRFYSKHLYDFFRYDCRGYLYDLEPYDSDLINKTVTRLTNEEIEIENLCEQERYADLIDEESKIQKDGSY